MPKIVVRVPPTGPFREIDIPESSQTPWAQPIDAAGFGVTDAGLWGRRTALDGSIAGNYTPDFTDAPERHATIDGAVTLVLPSGLIPVGSQGYVWFSWVSGTIATPAGVPVQGEPLYGSGFDLLVVSRIPTGSYALTWANYT